MNPKITIGKVRSSSADGPASDQSGSISLPGEKPVVPGIPGKSAYEIAVEEGFKGNKLQWLESLKGEAGSDAHVDLSGYARKTELPSIILDTASRKLTVNGQDISIPQNVDLSGYAKKAELPSIAYDKDTRTLTVNGTEVVIPESVDLSPYYTKAEVDARIENGTQIDLSPYVKSQELSTYAKKIDIPSLEPYETKDNASRTYATKRELSTVELTPGPNGKSAYDIWKSLGNNGTETDFINSLKGKDGAKGDPGAQGIPGKNGDKGESAYEIAKRNGYSGTEKEWLQEIMHPKAINQMFDVYSNKYHINMPTNGFLNDVQGAFYRDGLWHMYFLYNEDAKYDSAGNQKGGNGTEWYHVTTQDWIKYTYEGVAIHKYKTDWGDVASGSIYIDFDNRFGKGNNAVIVFATAYGGDKGQNIMAYYSTDNGYNFQPIQEDPVMHHPTSDPNTNFRDPYLFRMGNTWVMYMAEGDKIGMYTSSNPLSGYSYAGGYYPPHPLLECPALFEMNVNGNDKDKKWVLFYGGNGGEDLSTGTYASVGNLNDKFVFTAEQDDIRIDQGPDYYGAKMFSDNNAYVYSNAWMGNWSYSTKVPNQGRMGSLSLTRKLTLLRDGNKYKFNNEVLGVYPKYINNPVVGVGVRTDSKLPMFKGDSFCLKLHLRNMSDYHHNVFLKFAGYEYDVDFLLDFAANTVRAHRYNSSFTNNNEFSKDRTFNTSLSGLSDVWLDFYFDRTSIEVKFPDGKVYTMTKYPKGRSYEAITVTADQPIMFDYEYYQVENSDE